MPERDGPQSVGLLTLPLSINYGGILQMVALYEVLKQEGFAPVLLDKRARFRTLREVILSFLGKVPMQDLRGARSHALAARAHRAFFESRIDRQSRPVWSGRDLEKEVARLGIGSVVVGSDQVWRIDYQKDAEELNYFLDFGGENLRRVSYAASFGHGDWRVPKRLDDVQRCLSRFDAISVREQSGQKICAETFGRNDAQFVLDPTLLHEPRFYRSMLPAEKKPPAVLAYVLDRQDDARALAGAIAETRGVPLRVLSPSARDFMSIPGWLAEFANAEFVVTDSFHGTIFSILFGKPFLTLLNSRRGLDRFTSLFDITGLQSRGVTEWDGSVPEVIAQDPDFARVMQALERHREESRFFLRKALA